MQQCSRRPHPSAQHAQSARTHIPQRRDVTSRAGGGVFRPRRRSDVNYPMRRTGRPRERIHRREAAAPATRLHIIERALLPAVAAAEAKHSTHTPPLTRSRRRVNPLSPRREESGALLTTVEWGDAITRWSGRRHASPSIMPLCVLAHCWYSVACVWPCICE